MNKTMIHFKDSNKENSKKTMRERRTWPNFISCTGKGINKKSNPATNTSLFANYPELAHSSARTFFNNSESTSLYDSTGRSFTVLNINSTLAVLPNSPSPICSSDCSLFSHKPFSPISDAFHSQCSSTLSNVSKLSASSIGIDGSIEDGNNICSYQPNMQKKVDEGGKWLAMGMSSVCESAVTDIDNEIHSITLTSKNNHSCSEADSPINGRHKLMTRPKPYHDFLDELKKQKLEAKVDEWKKAKHMKYMDRLTKKEACISNWEFKETSKVMNKMKETQRKLEMERIKALEKKQEKISRIQSIAAEKKARERQSTSNKISSVTKITEKMIAARSLIRLKLMRLVS